MTIGFAIVLAAPTASSAAEIKVLTTRAMNHVLTELAGAFERTTGHKVKLILAPPIEIEKRVVDREIVVVVMSGSAAVDNLVKQGNIAPGDRLTLARVRYGVAVRAGAPKPDISSVEAFRRTLLAAKSIVYSDPAIGGGGKHVEKVLDLLGFAEEIKAKSIKNPRAATKPSAEFVARGEAELGFQLISEIVSVPGAELLGDMLMEDGKPVEALAAYERSQVQDPNRYRSLYGAGQAAAQSGSRDKARYYFSRLFDLAGSGDLRPEMEKARRYLASN